MSSFRLNARAFALTYPQCPVMPDVFLPALLTRLRNVDWVYIAREPHNGGDTFHLHVCVFLETKWDIKDQNALDVTIDGVVYHGNYGGCRDMKAWFAYVRKGIGTPTFCDAVFGKTVSEIEDSLDRKKAVRKRTLNDAFDRLVKGESLADLLKDPEMVGSVILHGPKLQVAVNLLSMAESSAPKKLDDVKVGKSSTFNALNDQTIVDWLKLNLVGLPERKLRQKQLWLGGVRGCGKTSFIIRLSEFFRVYFCPMSEDWYDSYDDKNYDVVVFEEMYGQKMITFMNSFCDGQHMHLKKKGGQIFKKKKIPVIVLSNYDIEQCYHNVMEKNRESVLALKDRFTEIYYSYPYVAVEFVEAGPVMETVPVVVSDPPPVSVPNLFCSEQLDLTQSYSVCTDLKPVVTTPYSSPSVSDSEATIDLTQESEENPVDLSVVIGNGQCKPLVHLDEGEVALYKRMVEHGPTFAPHFIRCHHVGACGCLKSYMESYDAYGCDPGPVNTLSEYPLVTKTLPTPFRCCLKCLCGCLSSSCGHTLYWSVGESSRYYFYGDHWNTFDEMIEKIAGGLVAQGGEVSQPLSV